MLEKRNNRYPGAYWVGFLFLLFPSLLSAQAPDVPPRGVPFSIRDSAAIDRRFKDCLILIAFQNGATRAEKDSAVTRIRGRIVGGIPIEGNELDGWYLVQLGADGEPAKGAYFAGQELAYLPWVHTWTRWNHQVEVALADLSRTASDPVGDVLTVRTRSRSVWGNLDARFAPFESGMREIRVDGAYRSGQEDGGRIWTMESARVAPSDSASLRVMASAAGRTSILRAPEWVGEPGVGAFNSRSLMRTEPEAFLLPFLFGPAEERERAGPWIHRVALGDADPQSLGVLEGERVISFIRDSLTADMGLFRKVRDSARIKIRRSWGVFDYDLGDTIRMSENLEGTVLGLSWLDPFGLVSSRQDTVVLYGSQRGEFPDGRVMEVPLRYEAERTVTRSTPVDYLVGYSEERRDGGSGGMPVPYEATELERRLLRRDPVATDSVLRLWRSASDPGERQDLFTLLNWSWADRSLSDTRELLLQEGDTAIWIDQTVREFRDPESPPLTSADLDRLLPFLDNPARLWGIGRSGGSIYSDILEGLIEAPPALTTDTTEWALTPQAFKLLGGWRERAKDPRLRDLAAFAWFVLDPAPRYAELAALGNSDNATSLSRRGLLLANGAPRYGHPDRVGVPPIGSPAEQWVQWADDALDPLSGLDLGLFHAAHPERDLHLEVAERFRDATTEEGRSVFRRVGQRLGSVELPSPEDIVASVANGEPLGVSTAELDVLLDSASPAPTSVVFSIVDRLLESRVNGTPLWDKLNPKHRRDGPGKVGPTDENLFLLDKNLPPGLREAWGDRIPFISKEEWDGMDPRRAAQLLQVREMPMAGPILYLSYSALGRLDRAPQQHPYNYLTGFILYLAFWEGEWWLLGPSMTFMT